MYKQGQAGVTKASVSITFNNSDRSRSPGLAQPAGSQETAERAMVAPVYVEPGAAGDSLGVEERHRTNVRRLFLYMTHVEKLVNNHAEILDEVSRDSRAAQKTARAAALETKTMKNDIRKADHELKDVMENNDAMVKAHTVASLQQI